MAEVEGGERGGWGGDVDAVEVEGGDVRGEEGVEVERDAACACAEVEDSEGWWRGRGGGEEAGGEVGGYVFCFWSVIQSRLVFGL